MKQRGIPPPKELHRPVHTRAAIALEKNCPEAAVAENALSNPRAQVSGRPLAACVVGGCAASGGIVWNEIDGGYLCLVVQVGLRGRRLLLEEVAGAARLRRGRCN